MLQGTFGPIGRDEFVSKLETAQKVVTEGGHPQKACLLALQVSSANLFFYLRIVVSAEGIESALKQQTKNLVEHSWQYKAL